MVDVKLSVIELFVEGILDIVIFVYDRDYNIRD